MINILKKKKNQLKMLIRFNTYIIEKYCLIYTLFCYLFIRQTGILILSKKYKNINNKL